MHSEVMVENLSNQDLPAYEVTIQVTTCQNRFEILAKPGAEIDIWRVQALLANWIQSRIDAQNPDGHNWENFLP